MLRFAAEEKWFGSADEHLTPAPLRDLSSQHRFTEEEKQEKKKKKKKNNKNIYICKNCNL